MEAGSIELLEEIYLALLPGLVISSVFSTYQVTVHIDGL